MPLELYAAVPDSVPIIRCSPPSWAAQIALLEEGLSHELHWLRFDRGEHRSADMLRLHPAGTVPVLVDESIVAILATTRRRASIRTAWPATWPRDAAKEGMS